MSTGEVTTHRFEAEVSRVLSLVINSLYSQKEIFLRELISNASDALDQLRFEAITNPEFLQADSDLLIRIIPDKEAGTLTIYDTGMGMNREDLIHNLGTVARSGTMRFLEQMEESKRDEAQFIGQFGVGFYSAFLVADNVVVISRKAGSQEAFKWSSQAGETFTVEPAERDRRGTTVILNLTEEQSEYLEEYSLRRIVKQYSDFVSHPIELQVERQVQKDDEDKSEQDLATQLSFERVNEGSALWQRSKDELTKEQYEEFYHHVAFDWEPPLTWTHFKIEGANQFTGLLYIPKREPWDLFESQSRSGVKLYVKRVFIMDRFDELLPPWLRFIKGVIDSDDLPLNISRETLQDSRVVRTIRKQVIKKTLSMLEELASDRKDDYLEFWQMFGRVLKEGVHLDAEFAERLSHLLRYESSKTEGLSSLAEYVERMSEGQDAIYLVMGHDKELVENSPHMEKLQAKGYEILYMTDPIDQWVIQGLSDYEGKKLVNAMSVDLEIEQDQRDEAQKDEEKARFGGLLEKMKETLSDHVREVRLSNRMIDSPVCLVIPEGGLPAHIERLLRLQDRRKVSTKRILEINPDHPLIAHLQVIHEKDSESESIAELAETLFDQALLLEGSPLTNPIKFSKRLTSLLEASAAAAVTEAS